MEVAIRVHIERLPEGGSLTTSDEPPGLVAERRTVAETFDIARDDATKLCEARRERREVPVLSTALARQDYTMVVGS